MDPSLQETGEKFKTAMEEMQRKVISMRVRMDEVYRKINQLDVHQSSLANPSNRLGKQPPHHLSYQAALFEDRKAILGREPKGPWKKGNF